MSAILPAVAFILVAFVVLVVVCALVGISNWPDDGGDA